MPGCHPQFEGGPGLPHPPGTPQTQAWGPLERSAGAGCGGPRVFSPLWERGRCRGWAGAARPGPHGPPPAGPAGAGRSPPGNGAGRGAAPAGPPLSPTPGRCRPDSTAPTHGEPGGTSPWGTLQGWGCREGIWGARDTRETLGCPPGTWGVRATTWELLGCPQGTRGVRGTPGNPGVSVGHWGVQTLESWGSHWRRGACIDFGGPR